MELHEGIQPSVDQKICTFYGVNTTVTTHLTQGKEHFILDLKLLLIEK